MSIRSSGFSKWMCDGSEVKKDEMRASREGRDRLREAVTVDTVSVAVVKAVLAVVAAVVFGFVVEEVAETFKEKWSLKPGSWWWPWSRPPHEPGNGGQLEESCCGRDCR